jgi:CheY-like chemotaxis protein
VSVPLSCSLQREEDPAVKNTASLNFVEKRIQQHLPYLTRFARSLTGSRIKGDGLVAQMMAELAEDDRKVLGDLNSRVALYREFLILCHRLPSDSSWNTQRSGVQVDKTTFDLCETSRVAMLLSAIEGFNRQEICDILQITESMLHAVLQQISARLAVKTGQKICIIEDEPLIAMQIHDLLTRAGYKVCSVSRTESQAAADVLKHSPDLIVSDVKLANGGSGPDVVLKCVSNRSIPVVFVTAFPETLLTGRGIEPTFLISKPFQPAMLQAAVNQALFFKSPAFSLTDD